MNVKRHKIYCQFEFTLFTHVFDRLLIGPTRPGMYRNLKLIEGHPQVMPMFLFLVLMSHVRRLSRAPYWTEPGRLAGLRKVCTVLAPMLLTVCYFFDSENAHVGRVPRQPRGVRGVHVAVRGLHG